MVDTVGRVYELMAERGLTLYRLCEICGINHSTVVTTRKRNGQLKLDTIERICEGLGITVSEFFAES